MGFYPSKDLVNAWFDTADVLIAIHNNFCNVIDNQLVQIVESLSNMDGSDNMSESAMEIQSSVSLLSDYVERIQEYASDIKFNNEYIRDDVSNIKNDVGSIYEDIPEIASNVDGIGEKIFEIGTNVELITQNYSIIEDIFNKLEHIDDTLKEFNLNRDDNSDLQEILSQLEFLNEQLPHLTLSLKTDKPIEVSSPVDDLVTETAEKKEVVTYNDEFDTIHSILLEISSQLNMLGDKLSSSPQMNDILKSDISLRLGEKLEVNPETGDVLEHKPAEITMDTFKDYNNEFDEIASTLNNMSISIEMHGDNFKTQLHQIIDLNKSINEHNKELNRQIINVIETNEDLNKKMDVLIDNQNKLIELLIEEKKGK
ncbi:hypothetical protein [Methanosphaera sp. WGK6]|uniref:hypothetical protein n=1 Tax=Methanosphaera sp. WGK6 TaxID=1561964 RepID=UPI00084C1520|nr:hypothetical protein [Methanosphaera sp. WGK6]OED29492.1 hypothetical protein NL43_07970 [Methanosphaera sp. WGK6]